MNETRGNAGNEQGSCRGENHPEPQGARGNDSPMDTPARDHLEGERTGVCGVPTVPKGGKAGLMNHLLLLALLSLGVRAMFATYDLLRQGGDMTPEDRRTLERIAADMEQDASRYRLALSGNLKDPMLQMVTETLSDWKLRELTGPITARHTATKEAPSI